MKNIFIILYLLVILIITYYIVKYSIFYINNYYKIQISKSLIIVWDIYCKKNFLKYINDEKKIHYIVHISDIGFIIQKDTNYIVFISKHPQEYSEIDILFNYIINTIKKYNLKNIISFSTAGSHKYNIGSVLQFTSAIIDKPCDYSLNFNYIDSKNILIKTDKIVNNSITDTKGFINPSKHQFASGEDEFVIYYISNKLNIPSLTLTGISDNDNNKEYGNGGGNLAAKNVVTYFFDNFYLS